MEQKNKFKTVFKIMLIVAILTCIILFILYCIDMHKMKNNQEVFFSTWGHSYKHQDAIPENELKTAVTDYLVTKLDKEYNGYEQEKGFTSFKTYLIEEASQPNIYNLYCWVLEETYYLKDGKIAQDMGQSLPYKFAVRNENGKYKVLDAITPRDGIHYNSDIKATFPANIVEEFKNIRTNGVLDELSRDIQNQVNSHFKK